MNHEKSPFFEGDVKPSVMFTKNSRPWPTRISQSVSKIVRCLPLTVSIRPVVRMETDGHRKWKMVIRGYQSPKKNKQTLSELANLMSKGKKKQPHEQRHYFDCSF